MERTSVGQAQALLLADDAERQLIWADEAAGHAVHYEIRTDLRVPEAWVRKLADRIAQSPIPCKSDSVLTRFRVK